MANVFIWKPSKIQQYDVSSVQSATSSSAVAKSLPASLNVYQADDIYSPSWSINTQTFYCAANREASRLGMMSIAQELAYNVRKQSFLADAVVVTLPWFLQFSVAISIFLYMRKCANSTWLKSGEKKWQPTELFIYCCLKCAFNYIYFMISPEHELKRWSWL